MGQPQSWGLCFIGKLFSVLCGFSLGQVELSREILKILRDLICVLMESHFNIMLEPSLIEHASSLIQSLIAGQTVPLCNPSLKAVESVLRPGFHKELKMLRSETTSTRAEELGKHRFSCHSPSEFKTSNCQTDY
jgi:hypothetical protein